MEVEKQPAIANKSAPRHMSITEKEVAARVRGGISPGALENFGPMVQPGIIAIHQLHLAEMDRLTSGIDVGPAQVGEPQPRFHPAHIRHRSTPAPLIAAAATGVNHLFVAKVASLDRQFE